MEAKDAERAALLVRALREWPGFDKVIRRNKSANYNYRIFEMQFGDSDDGQACDDIDGWVAVDAATGRKIVAAAKKIIAEELHSLGVKGKP